MPVAVEGQGSPRGPRVPAELLGSARGSPHRRGHRSRRPDVAATVTTLFRGEASQRSGVPATVRGGETSGGDGWDGGGPEDERGRRPRCSARPVMASTATTARA
jgi:hypothetical protein